MIEEKFSRLKKNLVEFGSITQLISWIVKILSFVGGIFLSTCQITINVENYSFGNRKPGNQNPNLCLGETIPSKPVKIVSIFKILSSELNCLFNGKTSSRVTTAR